MRNKITEVYEVDIIKLINKLLKLIRLTFTGLDVIIFVNKIN